MFARRLQENYEDLYRKAQQLSIDVAALEGLNTLSPTEAIRVLRNIISEREKYASKINHQAEFVHQYGDDIHQFFLARNALVQKIDEYNTANASKLSFDVEAETEDALITVRQRAKKGSVVQTVTRNLEAFAQTAQDNGYSLKLRVKPSLDEPYQFAMLQTNGTIKADNEEYKELRDWVGSVYDAAVARGKRNNTRGSPWRATHIETKKGTWINLDTAYKLLSGDDGTDESEDGLEDDEELEETTE